MLENLRTSLRTAIKKIVGASDVNEQVIDSLCKDVQRALLQSDVGVKLVVEITRRIKERALNELPPKGLSRKDHIVSILYSELSRLLGFPEQTLHVPDGHYEEKNPSIHVITGKINIFLMVGIQGSGKTTVTAKLARWLTKQGYRVAVIGADTWRPGALTQLKMNCMKLNVEVYGDESSKDASEIVLKGLHHFENSGVDVIIIDTAGRHKDE
ncbi:MAG TPA: signal recognition particle receptor subunit alpha, partial [Nitrososphaeraceae archaeon]